MVCSIVFARCRLHWGKLGEGYIGALCIISYNCMWCCDYLKRKRLIKKRNETHFLKIWAQVSPLFGLHLEFPNKFLQEIIGLAWFAQCSIQHSHWTPFATIHLCRMPLLWNMHLLSLDKGLSFVGVYHKADTWEEVKVGVKCRHQGGFQHCY